MVAANDLQYIRSIAGQVYGTLPSHTAVHRDDLVQAGLVGLLEARKRYRPESNTPLLAFAYQRVRGSMLDELRSYDTVSRSLRRFQRRRDGAVHELECTLGRAPEEREIAAQLGVTVRRLRDLSDRLQTANARTEELDAEGSDEVCAAEPTALENLLGKEVRLLLESGLGKLPFRQQHILRMRYLEGCTLAEVASRMNLSERGVNYHVKRATEALREQFLEMGLNYRSASAAISASSKSSSLT
jgi:RNA polymerase sigma factor FliA